MIVPLIKNTILRFEDILTLETYVPGVLLAEGGGLNSDMIF